jgi:hypothetical protein
MVATQGKLDSEGFGEEFVVDIEQSQLAVHC